MESEDLVDLEDLSDCEKAKILQVLKRNNHVKHREERRLWQLAVREQIQRVNDHRSFEDESKLKVKTGEWHKDMIRRRGKSTDISSRLYRRMSIDLMTTDNRHPRTLVRSPSQPYSSQHPPTGSHARLKKSYSDVNHNNELDASKMKFCQKTQEVPNSESAVVDLKEVKEKLQDNNISMNIPHEESQLRDI